MDFIVKLPDSDGHNVIMVVVDTLTKCAHFLYLQTRRYGILRLLRHQHHSPVAEAVPLKTWPFPSRETSLSACLQIAAPLLNETPPPGLRPAM